jgi:predicted nucleotidyltransferase
MINLEKIYIVLVQSILNKWIPNQTVWLFGSRVTDKIKPYSDIDLVIVSNQPTSFAVLSQIANAFSESDLPYKVDVVDWAMLDDEFKKIIKNNYEIIQEGKDARTS